MNFEEQKERYLKDPEFHALVNKIYNLIMEGNFTIGEIKDAVVFAGIKFELEQTRPLYYFRNHGEK